MADGRIDLANLDLVDLQALRLGAQVMLHKAELAARPRIELFFRGIQLTVDEELARRRRVSEDGHVLAHGSPLHLPPLHAPEEIAGAAGALAAATGTTGGGRSGVRGDSAAGAHAAVELTAGGADDRRLTAEYLDLLAANPRLSPAVRQAFRTLRDGLRPDA